MTQVDIVFIVLTYRNSKDMVDFIESVQLKVSNSYKIIVVNSYFDEDSMREIENVAKNYYCDFINVPNQGYGAGNNVGIEYANNNYNYKFLAICNPDTEIIRFDYKSIQEYANYIIAPEIRTLDHKQQNPFRLINNKLLEYLKYIAFKKKKYKLLYIDIAINKILKVFFLQVNKFSKRKVYNIYSCHGSFLILGRNTIKRLGPLYNEKMFLFAEEDHLAQLARSKKVSIIMNSHVSILHKEDGSMNFLEGAIIDRVAESYIEYYQTWYKMK
ncbi:hypothetical protein [Paenibacillus rhizophilus]|uniref:Glycosyltransferase family 2 protein n=1 Tax=Paenibacillus rhizophilus TaxID=1850366 RepID=A0A3N9P9D2_9BACL|nr:hypothetical protein [Paenibacillus rhizophilus]RQW12429.1 hypothetical protein EH198_08805 [Paenibacillus rhizophilus]